MAAEGQQYTEDNFANQQYADYGGQNYEGQYNQESMEEGNEGQQNQNLNGSSEVVPPKSASDEDRKLFIGGLSWDTEQKDLKEFFAKYGEVADVTIKTDPNTGKSRGFGFITFASEETVDVVLKNVPHTIKGKQIDPKRAKVRPGIKKIFVGGLDIDYPEADIKAHFEKYGKIEAVELPFDKVKNQRRQFCFVTFETEASCEASCKQAKQKIGNKECDVKKATNKPDPRQAGGSWGGMPSRGGRGGRGRGRGGSGFSQPQGWSPQGGYAGGYGGQGYGGYNQGYGNYGNYDYGYGGQGGYGGGYGNYDYSGWNYPQGGGYGGAGYGQQQSGYGKAPRRGAGGAGAAPAAPSAYHPYSR